MIRFRRINMKKTGMMFIVILFICALFAGQALAEQMRGEYGSGQLMETNRASEFIGKDVKNQQGEDLGDVNDVVFDNKGNINYVIISRGGVMGVGADLVPVPWKGKKFSVQDDAIILDMDRQKLEEAPSFSSGEWETFSEQGFQKRVHGYYGTEKGMKYKEKHDQN
jgi:sporulation protein YlmC with PRC-barrel domain